METFMDVTDGDGEGPLEHRFCNEGVTVGI
jgi:hypothetical protein